MTMLKIGQRPNRVLATARSSESSLVNENGAVTTGFSAGSE
jgi:hypothetical protein